MVKKIKVRVAREEVLSAEMIIVLKERIQKVKEEVIKLKLARGVRTCHPVEL